MENDDSKPQLNVAKRRPPAAGRGRKKGELNKVTRNLKAAILQAFDKVGGVRWLVTLAESDPRAFAALLGRILPNEIRAEIENNLVSDDPYRTLYSGVDAEGRMVSVNGRGEILVIDTRSQREDPEKPGYFTISFDQR